LLSIALHEVQAANLQDRPFLETEDHPRFESSSRIPSICWTCDPV
jgi:hypothetical protein